MTRVVLGRFFPVVLTGLLDILRSVHDIKVVATCAHGAEERELLVRHDPDLIVADHRSDETGAFALAREMRQAQRRTRVVLFCGSLSDGEGVAALRAGVRGILQLGMTRDEILSGVRSVAAGQLWAEPHLLSRTMERILQQDDATTTYGKALTPPQLAIVRRVLEGLPNKRIASQLGIAEGTVKVHLHHAYRKLDVGNRVELVLHAHENGLI